ncbi:hypothetical protein F5877DRAFT_92367 [Lentinula edodes]|nr:hypothetical protein F5877DRAFT_92367 [Lentinula edodes]
MKTRNRPSFRGLIVRCSFSRKQNIAIHWAMLALGVPNLPSDRTMDNIDKEMQRLCGVQSIRYEGKLGHLYYANDFAALISQEMSNQSVRPHLRFLPEDSGKRLSQACQAQRWLNELDPDLLTPAHCVNGQDHFTFEPAVLKDRRVCMPTRWFTRKGQVYAKAWPMHMVDNELGQGWAVCTYMEYEICSTDLLLTFKQFQLSHSSLGIPSPCNIVAEEDTENEFVPWERTDPTKGNRWRSRAQGKRVLAFPIWLYCDDTSGNVSKKWNKHNSFLFTAAGLPRHLCNKESNIHFFSTSNTAPPLEMLNGFVEQLSDAQLNGVWAWDSHYNDIVLLVPSVLGLLGDNPMQSEFACHIGFMGCLFCRVCRVSGKVEAEDDMEKTTPDEYESDTSVTSNSSAKTKGGKKSAESMADMITRITNFMSCASLRTRTESCAELKSQFVEGSRIGGGASFKRMKTESGVKDTYQAHFIDKIQAIATRKGLSKDMKQREIERLKCSLPQHLTSPVWRIKGLDPHQDTPVKILHVILLGIVKYYWRDAVARTKKDHNILIGRLSSFNTWGLGLSPLPGKTLVNYAGSLTGRDFRAVVQAAPFVLYGLLSDEQLETWKALSSLASLVWQPEIHDIDEYIDLEEAINYFLDCTCRLTPRWFNKPKFHVLLHLPAHIRRFGPAMLFATEGFESFNAIIRARSVHSNRHAPSKDIAHAMARSNRVCHLLNGDTTRSASKKRQSPAKSFHQRLSESPLSFVDHKYWRKASSDVQSLLGIIDFDAKLLGLQHDEDSPLTEPTALEQDLCRTFEAVCLQSGDKCEVRNWVIWNRRSNNGQIIPTVGMVIEILQMMRSPEESHGLASRLTIDRAIAGEYHSYYGMRHIELTGEFAAVAPQDVLCVVNVQHNCYQAKCTVQRTATVMKEREESEEKELRIEHTGMQSFILNTAQMRSSAYLKPFRKHIVHEAVRREITNRKQKSSGPSKSSALQANTGGPVSHLQANPRRNQYQPATPSTLSHQNNLSPMGHSLPVCLPEMVPSNPPYPTSPQPSYYGTNYWPYQ